jgi:hypothetical protein
MRIDSNASGNQSGANPVRAQVRKAGTSFAKIGRYPDLNSDAVLGLVESSEGIDVTAPHPKRSSANANMRRTASELYEGIDVWVNEGGAGGEANR